ncbi:PREDICTED: IQ domain-containing protein E [Dipodomys ordii]|uniref:IQ domain-containing protein E n=1 Tax=Dipodomys ordii TaxID=10020 RepID=A0A1S3FS09_DIPOR|nr:PREDICTED: IQ domain-containing protein E [Dipodomys ordii]
MAESAASGRRGRVPAVSLGTEEPASETGDDSLSAITFDSDTELKTERKVSHKPLSTSPKSPYYSKPRKMTSWRSLRTTGGMPLSSRLSQTPPKLWLGAAKQGHTPGITIYREKEDMYDEITELKKLLHMQKNDVDLMRTKLRRLEEENNRKDRQIEQLLDPGRGSDFIRTLADKRPDSGWVITGLKQRIFRLEQQCKEKDGTISKLQADMKTTNLEEMRIAMETYDEEIHRLQTLLASSEASGKKPLMEKPGLKRQRKMSSALLNLSRSVQELTEENQSLKEDLDRVLSNSPTVSKTKSYVDWSKPRLLRRIAELERKLSSQEGVKLPTTELARLNPLPPSTSSTSVHKLPKAPPPPPPQPPPPSEEPEPLQEAMRELRQERSWLRGQLLEFEVEVKQLLHTKASLEQELEKARKEEQKQWEREQALQEEIQTLTRKCQELEETKREETHVPLDVAPMDVASMGEVPIDLSPVDLSPVDLSPVDLSPVDLSPMDEASIVLTPEDVTSVDAAPVDLAPVDLVTEDPELLLSPSPCSEHSHPDLELDSCSEEGQEGCPESLGPDPIPSPCSDRREVAARTLQAWWKAHQQQRRKVILDEATVALQVAFRGHLARARLLSRHTHDSISPPVPDVQDQHPPEPRVPSPTPQTEASPGQEEAITIIQSALRGHLARDRYSATSKGTATTVSPRKADQATLSEATSLPSFQVSPDKEQSEMSSEETTEDEPQPRSGETPGPQLLSAEPFPPDPQPTSPLPVDDSTSDSDDDIIIAPSLPMKNNSSPF